jgi:predicted nucleic acid-binding protein
VTLVVDASVLVAVFWPDDPRNAISRSWIERQTNQEEEILIPSLLMAELAGPIRRRTGDRSLAMEAVDAVLDLPGVTVVPVTEELGRLAGELAATLALKGGDAIYAALAFSEDVPLYSWDGEQLERCSGHVDGRMPN